MCRPGSSHCSFNLLTLEAWLVDSTKALTMSRKLLKENASSHSLTHSFIHQKLLKGTLGKLPWV